jgi:hypothetical protein
MRVQSIKKGKKHGEGAKPVPRHKITGAKIITTDYSEKKYYYCYYGPKSTPFQQGARFGL